MNFQFIFRHNSNPSTVRRYLEKKLQPIIYTFAPKATLAEVEVIQDKDDNVIKIGVQTPKRAMTYVQARGKNLFATIHTALDKLRRTLHRQKEKIKRHKGRHFSKNQIIENNLYPLEPMGYHQDSIDAEDVILYERYRRAQ